MTTLHDLLTASQIVSTSRSILVPSGAGQKIGKLEGSRRISITIRTFVSRCYYVLDDTNKEWRTVRDRIDRFCGIFFLSFFFGTTTSRGILSYFHDNCFRSSLILPFSFAYYPYPRRCGSLLKRLLDAVDFDLGTLRRYTSYVQNNLHIVQNYLNICLTLTKCSLIIKSYPNRGATDLSLVIRLYLWEV